MKKYISITFLALFLAVFPIKVKAAQLTPEQITNIQNVIQSLLIQVQSLMEQLRQIQAGQSVQGTVVQDTTPTPVVPVFGGTQIVNPIPAPTCILTGQTYTDPIGNIVGKVSWASTNGKTGYLVDASTNTQLPHNMQTDFYDSGQPANSSISSGYMRSLTLLPNSPTTFVAHVLGDGGEAICKVDIEIPKQDQYNICAKNVGTASLEYQHGRCDYLLQ